MIFHNSIQAQPTAWRRTPDGFLRCTARVLAERVMPYHRSELENLDPSFTKDTVNMLVTKDAMSEATALRSLEGAPVVIGDHQWLSPDVIKEYGVGSVAGTPIMDGPYLVCDLLITHPEAIARIESRELPEISAAYTAETVFEPGAFNGEIYDSLQRNLQFNHVAVIGLGRGRAGEDVRILNKKQKGDKVMIRVQLKNTGKFVNVESEEDANAIVEDGDAQEVKARSFDETVDALGQKNGELEAIQAEVEELKGELSVYKEKLDELLSEEAVEHAAEGMLEEQSEAAQILENAIFDEEDQEKDGEKRDKMKNSIRKVHGTALHETILNSIGITTEGMSPEALKGAFKGQFQVCNMKSKRSPNRQVTVAGARIFNSPKATAPGQMAERSPLERLGFFRNKK